MTGDIILLFIVLGLGILIGHNWRFDGERKYKARMLRELENDLTEELSVAKNLNQSLLQDVAELKSKIRKLELERHHDSTN